MSKEKDKRAADDVRRLAEDETRKKARSIKEQKIAEDLRARASRDSVKRTAEGPGEEAKEEARRKTYSQREEKIAADLKARDASNRSQ